MGKGPINLPPRNERDGYRGFPERNGSCVVVVYVGKVSVFFFFKQGRLGSWAMNISVCISQRTKLPQLLH